MTRPVKIVVWVVVLAALAALVVLTRPGPGGGDFGVAPPTLPGRADTEQPQDPVVTNLEPRRDTEAKAEQAKIDEIANPPGRRARNTLAASNNPPVMPVWKATKPISKNIGTALIVQLATKE